tara:strand:+ start:2823 stop:3278 length:456 start_codon:yes stop_codon:yes gene_type:complete
MRIKFTFIILILSSIILGIESHHKVIPDGSYITGEDGVIRMYINITGNVRSPGSFMVYEGIDFLSALSMAGGYLQGSKLNAISVYSVNNKKRVINLNEYLENPSNGDIIKLYPHDTIYIEEKTISRIFSSSNIPSIILGILNIALTLERTQ